MSERPLRWYLARGLSAGLFALVALVAALVVVVPAVAGASTFTITGRSMEPTLPLGSLIVTRPATDVAIGDIVTFQLESGRPEVATHRIVGMTFTADGRAAYVTKGDANAAPDTDPVLADQVRGRLWYSVPLIGWVNYVLTGQLRSWLVPAVVVVLCAYAGWMFVGAYRDRRRRRTSADADPELDPDTDTAVDPDAAAAVGPDADAAVGPDAAEGAPNGAGDSDAVPSASERVGTGSPV